MISEDSNEQEEKISSSPSQARNTLHQEKWDEKLYNRGFVYFGIKVDVSFFLIETTDMKKI